MYHILFVLRYWQNFAAVDSDDNVDNIDVYDGEGDTETTADSDGDDDDDVGNFDDPWKID